MTASTVIILILIGLVAGVFSGLIGIGGALIIIPALIFILHMDQYAAQGTSLAIMLPPIGLLAAYNYYKAGALNLQYALIIAGAFFIGGYLGSKFALAIPLDTLRKIFAIVLLAIAVKMLWGK
ncbi:MAG: sulfite exporter TauE/SafE family protein [Bacteroidales bacterium]|nr:sulfite exporter TauE/SafE family protein [Bacteroidales bacterium]MDD4086227.1 sulfite exporter TauE/SafE family protein [Bacteroidales bacterium]MDY0084477.1 sulfite exporter TauE/SafE family protein [Bacteroidales bacterium]